MATITSSTGSTLPNMNHAFDTDPNTILTTTGTHYAWETGKGDKITLVGSFAYPTGTGNPPTGTVAQVLITMAPPS